MKTGQYVAVCHDGKWGRRVKGQIIATRKGHHIKVRFFEPVTEAFVEFWARKEPPVRYWLRKHGSCLCYAKRYGKWGGWSKSTDIFSPWFGVYQWDKADDKSCSPLA